MVSPLFGFFLSAKGQGAVAMESWQSNCAGLKQLDDGRIKFACPLNPDHVVVGRPLGRMYHLLCLGDCPTDQVLSALGLTQSDLTLSSTQETPVAGPRAPQESFSTNGAPHGPSNGKTRAFGSWQIEAMYVVKGALDDIAEDQRPGLASTKPEILIGTIVQQAKELIAEKKRPLWPLPELNESEVDEELHRLAERAVAVFRDAYLPAIAEEHLPAGIPGRSIVICETAEQAEISNQEYMSRAASVAQLYYECAISLGVGGKHEGKTTATRTEGLAISAGEPVYGRATLQQPVIYAASDDEYATTRMELLRMGWLRRRLPLRLVKINTQESPEPEQILAEIARIAETEGSRFVILDMLFDFIRVQDEIKYAQTRTAIGHIQTLADEISGHVKATHHSPKWMPDATTAAKAALGSQGIVAKFSPILLSKKWADDLYSIESTMTRDPRGLPIPPTCIKRTADGWAETTEPFKNWMKWKLYSGRILGLFEGEPGKEFTVQAVAQDLTINRPEAQNALYQMCQGDDPVLERYKPTKGRGYKYRLKTGGLFGTD